MRLRDGLRLVLLFLALLAGPMAAGPANAQVPPAAETPPASPAEEPAGGAAPTRVPLPGDPPPLSSELPAVDASGPAAAELPEQGDAQAAPSPAPGGEPSTPALETGPTPTAAEPLNVREHMARLRSEAAPTTFSDRVMSLVGLLAMVLIAWALSVRRDAVDLRLVGVGVGLQIAFGILVLKTAPGLWLFDRLNDVVVALLGFTKEGTRFLLGSFVTGQVEPAIVNFVFDVLPTIIFFSSLMTVLYYLGLMQHLVNGMARIMQVTMRTSGSETLSAAANIFVGQTEAPLVVKPYVATMTRSELMAVMTGGFATVAGGVMAAYVGMLQQYFPDIAGHLIAASVMSAPAALVIAKIMFPETEQSMTRGHVKMTIEKIDVNVIDAAARGASEGMTLALNVAAMLLAFIALVAMLNALLGIAGGLIGFPELSLQLVLGYLFWPIAWIMGIPAADCMAAAQLLGIKMVLNEFVAYLSLADLLRSSTELSYRTVVILTYALCGFANFSSIAIQIGGIGGIAPSRRHDLARLGLRAMIGGTIAAFMTATVAGLLI
jgi:concentrative nucleoside transporter, CNT family